MVQRLSIVLFAGFAIGVIEPVAAQQEPQGNSAVSGNENRRAKCDSACVRTSAERAIQLCAPNIESQAPGDYDWLSRPYGTIFKEGDMPDPATPTIIRYRGDSIRILSPQREWVRAIYECGFDAEKQQVAFVNIRVGVLGKASAVPAMPPSQTRAPQAMPGQATQGQAQAPNSAPSAAPTSDRRRVGELDDVSVLQVKPSAKQR